ncbi:MAG TPA: AMMECR1 domain-containing protein, partial [Flavobacteriales bacterium]|nr:AMMECR1 domain-containing protein [Flavobacteriales bacterium]
SVSDKIVQAASNCLRDSKERWVIPYNRENIDKMDYKVELLQHKKNWKEYKGSEVEKYFKLNGKQGIYLPSGSSATYLPIVSRNKEDEWTINVYMTELSRKAGDKTKSGSEWKRGSIKIYESDSYTWDKKQQQINKT